MKNIVGSLKRKIILGYVSGLVIVLVSAGFILFNLVFLEERIKFFEIVTDFVDTVLEIRRYEKNYFLFHKEEDLKKARQYIDSAITLVQNNKDSFNVINLRGFGRHGERASDTAIGLLRSYKSLIDSLHMKDTTLSEMEKVRRAGYELTALAEFMAKAERQIINRTIISTKKSLIVSVVIFFTGTLIIALVVSRIVIRPLEELEKSMDSIASGRFEMLSITSEDKEIVSLKRAFERMIKEIFSQRDIIRSEKLTSLGTMLAGIAHEINNPLNNISTSAEILNEELEYADNEFKRELLEQILTETDRARDIVRSVLEYTREKDFRKEEIGLSKIINETLRFIKNDFPSHITLVIDVPEDISVQVDKQKFQHALLNIIKNAIEAMDDATREGRLSIKAREMKAGWVEIEISDTGTGIPEKIIDKIFDPFFTTKEVGKGTGLGLFVTHYIIEQHNGEITVESTPGKGTLFKIKIPTGEVS